MFLWGEKKYLESLKEDVDFSSLLFQEEFEFLKETNRLHQITNKVKNLTFLFFSG